MRPHISLCDIIPTYICRSKRTPVSEPPASVFLFDVEPAEVVQPAHSRNCCLCTAAVVGCMFAPIDIYNMEYGWAADHECAAATAAAHG